MNDDQSQFQNPENGQPPMNQVPPSPPPPPPGGYYVPPVPPPPMAPPPQQQRKSLLWIIPVSFAVGCLPWLILAGVVIGGIIESISGAGVPSERGRHIALVRVSGVITSGKSDSGLFSGTSAGSDDLIEQLERARKNSSARAIILRIDSPGGSPAASEEVYKEIQRVRKSGKKVYTSMADVAASGGYYIASASDRIYADSSTLTGSIGVIWDITDMSGLYKKIGFNPQVVKSGKFKDIGSPNRPLTPEERSLLQGIVMDTYGQFVKAVSEGRHIPEADVRKIADGRVFTGNQALKVKLVDEIGGLHETVRAVAKAAGIRGEPRVVEYKRKRSFSDIFGPDSERFSSEAEGAIAREMMDRMLRGGNSSSGLR